MAISLLNYAPLLTPAELSSIRLIIAPAALDASSPIPSDDGDVQHLTMMTNTEPLCHRKPAMLGVIHA